VPFPAPYIGVNVNKRNFMSQHMILFGFHKPSDYQKCVVDEVVTCPFCANWLLKHHAKGDRLVGFQCWSDCFELPSRALLYD